MLVKKICDVPEELFNNSLNEILAIDWSNITDPSRAKRSVFSSSKSIHLRLMDYDHNNKPPNLREICRIINCVDITESIQEYNQSYKLALWVFQQVNGLRLGRAMITRLEAKSNIDYHIDPYEYFEVYSRFHIPLITNENVVFKSENDSLAEHMPIKTLCRLNNRKLHGVVNNSNDYRIHLIVDIEIEGQNNIF